jgi:hypothetical protein
MDTSGAKDAAYFDAHPDRRHLWRGLYPEEATALRLSGFVVEATASCRVELLGPGVRVRRWSGVWAA